MELKNKIKGTIERIVSDARNKWSSYEEENECIDTYTEELENLILFGVSRSLPVDDILGLDQPYPLIDILTKLVEASDILMHENNYDRHGWEIITEVTKLAKEKIELLKAH